MGVRVNGKQERGKVKVVAAGQYLWNEIFPMNCLDPFGPMRKSRFVFVVCAHLILVLTSSGTSNGGF